MIKFEFILTDKEADALLDLFNHRVAYDREWQCDLGIGSVGYEQIEHHIDWIKKLKSKVLAGQKNV